MILMNRILTLILTGAVIASCGSKTEKKKEETMAQETTAKYEPNWESIKENYKDPDCYKKLKSASGGFNAVIDSAGGEALNSILDTE